MWKYEKSTDDKPKKVPYTINGAYAKINDPTTWAYYIDVMLAYEYSKVYDGIGFVFTADDDYVGVDLDYGIDEEVKNDIINTLNSYTELSPSGRGYHIIVKGKKKSGANRKGHIEVYDKLRYFTITKNVVDNKNTIEYRQKELDYICDKYLNSGKLQQDKDNAPQHAPQVEDMLDVVLDDDEVVKLAGESKNGSKFLNLMKGDITGYESQSDADLALCSILAFWTGKSPALIDKIFRNSGLYRDKWNEKHSGEGLTYGQLTIRQAINNCVDVYTPKSDRANSDADYIYLSDIKPVAVRWLLYPYIPLAKVVVVSGEQGLGKSMFVLYLISKLSNGISSDDEDGLFFGMFEKPKKIIYQNAEDGLDDTIVPRLIKYNANLNNIVCIPQKVMFNDKVIENTIREFKPDLVVFDPVQAFIDASTDTHKSNEVRQSLDSLIKLGDEYSCTIILVMHNNKMTNQKLLYRVTGSVDFTALPRSVLSVVQDPEDEDGILILNTKNNLAKKGKTLKFIKVDDKLEFAGYSNITPDRLDNSFLNTGRGSPKLEQAKEFLADFLKDGEKVKKEIDQELYNRGLDIGKNTLIKAAGILDVEIERQKEFKSWTIWRLKQNP